MSNFASIANLIVDGDWIESKDQSESGIRLIQTGNIGFGVYLDKSERAKYISEETFERLKCTEVYEGDILISRLPDPIGRACIVPKLQTRCITAVDCTIIRLQEKICDKRYFLHYTCSDIYYAKLSSFFSGSTRTRISRKNLEKTDIPLPPLEEQRKIAANLDKATQLIDLCNAILEKLDLLVKARFVEMFGNFVLEKDRWHTCTVGDVAGTVDPQPSHRTPPIDPNGIPYIGIAECDYQNLTIRFDTARKVGINVLQEHIARYDLHSGDFIIGKIGTIGKPFFIPPDRTYTLSANTVLIQPDSSKIVPYYLFSVFQSEYIDRIIDAEKKSTSQPAFGIQKVRNIVIPLPPLDLQKQYAAFVVQTDKTKAAVQQVLAKAETLKKALMQEYFG